MLREMVRVRAVLLGALAAMLVACGGGGGGSGGGGGGGGGGTPLAVSASPADQNVVAGDPATFSVVAAGSGTLAYQWSRDGTAIPGAAASTYTLASAALADDGARFAVRVTDSSGGVDSTAARLGVRSPITTGPASVTVAAGASASFSVVAEGHALSYQWQRDGADIAGAVAARYTTGAVSAADQGATFRVRVTNGSVSVLSDAAVLTVGSVTAGGVRPLRLGAGIGFALALRADGKVLTWGSADGGSSTPPAVPGTPLPSGPAKVVNGLSGMAQVVADSESLFGDALAVDGAGQVLRWGYGDTLLVTYPVPTAVAPLSPAVSLARCTGGTPKINIVRRADGTLWFGGTTQVTGIDHVVSLSELGGSASLAACTVYAVKSDGTVWSLLVNAARTAVQSVSQVAGLSSITQVSCGGGNLSAGGYCLALAADGTVWSWGGNGVGQLGDGSLTGSTVPLHLTGLTGITRVLAGTTGLSMALSRGNVLYTWGASTGRDLAEDQKVPTALAGWTDVQDIASGFLFGLALRADGSVWSWGSNTSGELGDGTTAPRQTPVQVLGVNLN